MESATNHSFAPSHWSIPDTMLIGTRAARSVNLGGWADPSVYGAVRDARGSTRIALLCLAIGPLISVGHSGWCRNEEYR